MRYWFILFSFVCGFQTPVWAEQLKEDNLHVRTWNQFAQNILALHKQRLKGRQVERKERIGGYSHLPDFYREESFYENGKLIALIQWEKENPSQLHSIELYIRDEKGRVIRDYAAAYLPHYHNAPTQTLISLHHYNNGLHAFRTFDASGYRIIERCSGQYKGKEINFILDEDEIAEALDDTYQKTGIMVSEDYQLCFGNLQTEAGIYVTPQ